MESSLVYEGSLVTRLSYPGLRDLMSSYQLGSKGNSSKGVDV